MNNKFHIAFVFDRHRITSELLAEFAKINNPVHSQQGSIKTKCIDISSEFSLPWPYKREPWLLYQNCLDQDWPRLRDPFEVSEINTLISTFSKVARTYSWALLPCGRELEMAMLAFITSDNNIFDQFLTAFKKHDSLLLANYSNVDSSWRSFCGVIFRDGIASEKLWDTLFENETKPYLVHIEQVSGDGFASKGKSGVVLFREEVNQSHERVITQISDRDDLNEHLRGWNASLVLAPNTDIRRLQSILHVDNWDMVEVAGRLKELGGFSEWVYLPERGYSSADLYQTFFSKNTDLMTKWLCKFDPASPAVYSVF